MFYWIQGGEGGQLYKLNTKLLTLLFLLMSVLLLLFMTNGPISACKSINDKIIWYFTMLLLNKSTLLTG